jgi:hypothetical protein
MGLWWNGIRTNILGFNMKCTFASINNHYVHDAPRKLYWPDFVFISSPVHRKLFTLDQARKYFSKSVNDPAHQKSRILLSFAMTVNVLNKIGLLLAGDGHSDDLEDLESSR